MSRESASRGDTMVDGNISELVLHPRVDSGEALTRFQSHMTSGLFRPRTLRTADWRPPRLLLIPARSVNAKATSNWTAESGTKSGSRMAWTPLSGRHQGVHQGLAFVVCDRWQRHEKRLLTSLSGAELLPEKPEAAELAAITMSEVDIEQHARELVQDAERRACAKMLPGASQRRLKLNTSIEDLTIQPLLLPVWEMEVADGGTVHRGWVNAVTGRVHAKQPTSFRRVGTAFGLAFGLPVVATLLSIAILFGALEARRMEQERLAAEQQRAAAEQWATSKDELTAAVAAGEEALETREPDTVRAAVKPAAEPLTSIAKHSKEPDVAALWERYQAVNAEAARIGTIHRGLATTKAIVNDADKCTNSEDLRTAWSDLRNVRADDPERPEAQRLTRSLERCRVKTGRQLNAALKETMMAGRVVVAERMERRFLDEGMDVRVQVQGSNKDRLKLTWPLFGRVTIHQMTDGNSMSKGSFLRNLEEAGFRKVTFSDGYTQSTWYDLEPEPDDMLAEVGLAEPFKLPN